MTRLALYPLILLFLLISFLGISQQLRFSHITDEQGLSQGVVNCILQDSKGFMWFGTQDGLNKYDGYTIKVYNHNPADTNSISDNSINCLLEDYNGSLWIGTNAGICSFDPKTEKFRSYLSEEKNIAGVNNIRDIVMGDSNLIWLATGNGIKSFNTTTKAFATHKLNNITGSIDPMVHSLCIDKNNNLWIGTNGMGLFLLNTGTKLLKNYNQININNIIWDISLDRTGKLLMATGGEGVVQFDYATEIFTSLFSDELPSNSKASLVISVMENENGDILMGTTNDGLSVYSPSRQNTIVYKNENENTYGISDNYITCIYKDNENNIWIGTYYGGVNVNFKSANKFKHIKRSENTVNSIQNNSVFALMLDSEDILWVGTGGGGLSSIERNSNKYTHYNSGKLELSTSSNETVLSLFEDSENIIWVGTWGGGVNSFNKKTKEIKRYLPKGTILHLMENRKGNIVVSTYGEGVYFIDQKGEIRNLNVQKGLSSNNIYYTYEDNDEQLWIGTDGGGVNLYNPNTGNCTIFKNQKQNSICSNTINCIHKDSKGNMWFGTQNGLCKMNLNTGKFENYFEKDGLPNDYIYGILEDKEGNLWLSTNKGISKFNPRIQNINNSAFRNYDVSDGLQGKEFNQGAYYKSKKAELFFGGTNGFNSFFPEEIINNTHIPPVYITNYKKFGKEVKLDTAITDKKFIELSYKENFISFEFVALDYLMSSQNKYSYKMEGVDEDWSLPSTMRFAQYTQLNPGEYTFHVKACNSDGVWNNEGALLHIKIIPPFWRTNWFYSLCILMAITGIFGFVRLRTGAIEKEKKMLEVKVRERTKELAEKNRDITSSIQYAKRIQEAILPSKDAIFRHFPEAFILYKPKDIVSGDFYWFGEKDGKRIIAVVDCTGHGVPGAFMSMIGHNLLNQIVIEKGVTEPGAILNELHKGVQSSLKQGTNQEVDTSDGMDVAICCFDADKSQVQYAGAYRPLFIVSNGKLERIDGNKYSIGGAQLDTDRQFANNIRFLNKGDQMYLFSDGYADQFGGEQGKKFMIKRLNELLLDMRLEPMSVQGNILHKTIESWMGTYEQVDDILVIGIKA